MQLTRRTIVPTVRRTPRTFVVETPLKDVVELHQRLTFVSRQRHVPAREGHPPNYCKMTDAQ